MGIGEGTGWGSISKLWVIVLSLAALSVIGVTEAKAQLVVSGTKVAFRIPDPVQKYPQEMFELMAYRQERRLPNRVRPGLVVSEESCAAQANVVSRIVQDIYRSNNLQDVFQVTPGILFEVLCPTSPYSALGNPKDSFAHIAFSTSTHIVSINALVFKYLKSEDELAYILGHEIAHIIFFHGLGQMHLERDLTAQVHTGQLPKIRASSIVWKYLADNEAQADKYGMLLSWNAGYSPMVVRRALDFVNSFSLDLSGAKGIDRLRKWLDMRKVTKHDYHGTHRERQRRVEDMFGEEQIKEFKKIKPKVSEEFIEAKSQMRAMVP